jgi:tetratricopeptide (TPR) repeat protein
MNAQTDSATLPNVDARAMLHLRRGVDAATAGRSEDAIMCFLRALEIEPGLAAAHANLGLLLTATGQPAQAEPHLAAALARMPRDAMLLHALGVAREALGRQEDAASAYAAALAERPEFAEAGAALGSCLRRLGRCDEARGPLERALAAQPGLVAAHCGLGDLERDLGRLEQAAVHYRGALALDADHLGALNNLGSCLRQLGELDAARAAYERVLALRPDQVETHCNLALLKNYRPGDPQVERLLAQRGRVPEMPEHGRVRYWFTAGKMLEDVGRHDEAFAAYREGNRLKHACTPWDEAGHLATHRRITAAFTRERLAEAADAAPADGPIPVFIVGMPRSGTSLIEQVLATLPGVHGAGELHDFGEVLQSAAGDHPGEDFLFPETLAAYPPDALRRLGRRYLERLRRLAPDATHVVDKLPANFTHLGLIHLTLPHARIVHAMRDPMDSCFSCWSRLFSADNLPFSYELGALGRYWRAYDALMRHWRATLPEGRILDLPYEAMVEDFEAQARRLVDHLGLPWDERCLGFHDHARIVKTASVAQVRRPIYRSSVARWKPFERHLASLMEIVGPAR